MTVLEATRPAGTLLAPVEVWERHPVYPHEGSNLGRIRTLDGKISSQRAHNRPVDVPKDERYRRSTLWIPGTGGEDGREVTVLVHQFITECHWGLKTDPRHQARHGRGPRTDNSWGNLLGFGPPELNNGPDKPKEVRVAAARKARAAQLANSPSRKRPVSPPPAPRGWLQRVTRNLPWSRSEAYHRRSDHLSQNVSQR